jgi:hypothetical protein
MSLADALGPLTARAKRSDAQTPTRSDAQTPRRSEIALQGTAKSAHPEYAKKTLYLRRSTMRDAMRRYEDSGGKEESELVELLLIEYVRGGFSG